MDTDLKGFNNTVGIFGKSINEIKEDLSNGKGLFGSIFGTSNVEFEGITSKDIEIINKYREEIDSGISKTEAFTAAQSQLTEAGKKGFKTYLDGTTTIEELEKSAKKTTAALTGARIATTIFNMAISALVMTGISRVIDAISNYINRIDNYKEKISEVTDSWNEQKNTLLEHTKTVNQISKEYDTLSNGVNLYGENVSLTSDQYERYIELTNQIADMYPDLVQGYDEQGNAILRVKGNVESLTEALKEEHKEYYRSILNDEESKEAWTSFSEITLTDGGYFDLDNKTLSSKLDGAKKILELIQEASAEADKIVIASSERTPGQEAAMEEAIQDYVSTSYDTGYKQWVVSAEDKNKTVKALQEYINSVNDEIQGYVNDVGIPIMEAYVKLNTEGLDTSAQNAIDSMISQLDFDWFAQFSENGTGEIDREAAQKWVDEHLIKPFKKEINGANLSDEWNKQLETVSQYELGKISTSDLLSAKKDFENVLKQFGIDPETRSMFVDVVFDKIEVTDGVSPENAIENILSRIKLAPQDALSVPTIEFGNVLEGELPTVANFDADKLVDTSALKENEEELRKVREYLETLNINQLTYLSENADLANTSLSKLKETVKEFDEEQKINTPFSVSFDDASESMENAVNAFSSIKNAITEYNETGSLSLSNLQALLALDDSYILALTNEQGALDLTTDKYKELIQAQGLQLKAALLQQSLDTVSDITTKAKALEYLSIGQDTAAQSALDLADAKWQEALATATAKDAEQGTGDLYQRVVLQAQEVYSSKAALIDKYIESATTVGELSTATDRYTDSLEAEKKALEKNKEALEAEKSALEDKKAALEDEKDSIDDAINSIKDLISLTEEYIKQTKEDEIDALEEKKKKIDDLVEAKKELLEQEKAEKIWNDEISEKQNDVASKALAASVASLDDSAEGRKNYKNAQDELNESRSDIKDTLYEHDIDARIDGLDQFKEDSDEFFDNQINTINEFLNNEVALYKAACDMIDNDNGTLYNNLLHYTLTYTTTTEAEFNHMWTSAQTAMQNYNIANLDTYSLLNNLQTKMYEVDGAIDTIASSIASYEDKINGVQSKIDSLSESAQTAASNVLMAIDRVDNFSKPKWVWEWQGDSFYSIATDRDVAIQDIIHQIEKKYGGRYPAGVSAIYGTGKSGIQKYASGTYRAKGGISLVGEKGAEYRILNQGDGIVTAKATENLEKIGNSPEDFVKDVIMPKLQDELYIPIDYSVGYLSSMNNDFMPQYTIDANGMDREINQITENSQEDNSTSLSPTIQINIQGDATQSTVKALQNEADKIVERATKNVMNIALRNKKII